MTSTPPGAGADGIYCSNHGGRQADGGLAALDCLPGVVAAADGLPVLFDSGVRSGADVIKTLALGATAVGIGRPYAWGLAIGGTDGVVHVLRSILAEADLIMAVDGYPALADLTPGALRRTGPHDLPADYPQTGWRAGHDTRRRAGYGTRGRATVPAGGPRYPRAGHGTRGRAGHGTRGRATRSRPDCLAVSAPSGCPR
jgi:FMN-dependent dehydrogenase